MTTESTQSQDQLAQEDSQDEARERSLILEVIVKQPGAPCNRYQYDQERRALVLERVLQVKPTRPADSARYPLERPLRALERIGKPFRSEQAAEAEQAPAVPVLLLSTVAVAPDTWVSARLIGALRSLSHHDEPRTQGWTLLAVPTADASQEHLITSAQLGAERRASLAAAFLEGEQRSSGSVPGKAAEAVEWLEAQEAARLVRQMSATWRQRQRQRQAQTASAQGPGEHLRIGSRRQEEPERRAAWRALAGISIAQLREQGLGAFAEAEHLLRFVPQRFQEYLSELLLDDERVLCFVERPRLRSHRGLLGLGARYLNDGLLLCTDRQVLWLRELAAPDATLVPWGYVARSCPVERLVGAQLIPPEQANQELGLSASPWVRLVVGSAAVQGTASLVIEFPAQALPALQQVVSLLERFLPFPPGSLQAVADRRVRRVPEVSVWQPHADEQEWLLHLGGLVPAEARGRLEEALRQALHPGEQVLAQAMAPALSGYPGGPRLLALTGERLLFAQIPDATRRKRDSAQTPTMQSVPLERIAAVQFRHSLFGCLFEVLVPGPDGQMGHPGVPFNSPGVVPFRAIYTRTRLLLSAPPLGNAPRQRASKAEQPPTAPKQQKL